MFTQLGPVPRPVLNAMYCASDIYATTSAEGFGLCIAESLMCGVPVVGMDYSAVPEVIGPAGSVVSVDREYDNEYDHRWAWPDEAKFAEAVEFLVTHPKRRRELGALGPQHVKDNFSWSNAARVIAETCGHQV
jgi:glycosyltransferase involved in cell wall biosynthesis